MAAGSDQNVGYMMIGVAALVFAYYTLWIVVLPFVEAEHVIHSYFLPRIYGVTIPIVAGLLVLASIGCFIIKIKLKSRKPKEKST